MNGNLEDIARLAGVAVSTVSRAIAGKPGVSAAKREQILELARIHAIAPNPLASGLRTGQSNGITIIIQPTPTAISARRNNALFALARESFGNVKVLVRDEKETLDTTVLTALSQKSRALMVSSMSGVLTAQTQGLLDSRKVPLVTVDGDSGHGDSLFIRRSTGTRQCARLFLLNGCTDCVLFSALSLDMPDERLRGFVEGFAEFGKELSAQQIVRCESDGVGHGYRLTKEVIGSRAPDALFCYNDNLALGAMRALGEQGVRIPGDCMVVGFDNLEFTAYTPVSLTTVAQPLEDIAHAAVTLCSERLQQYLPGHRILPFETSLIVRESAPVRDPANRIRVFESTRTGSTK